MPEWKSQQTADRFIPGRNYEVANITKQNLEKNAHDSRGQMINYYVAPEVRDKMYLMWSHKILTYHDPRIRQIQDD